jgi:type IV pilus assembly protein PilW
MAHLTRPARGYTLIELVVSIVVAAILVLAGMSILIQQQRLLQASSGDRAIQETARAALNEIGGNLRRAGYGIEPALAIDFNLYTPATATLGTAPVTCRDSVDRSDEIVFYARDPAFKTTLAAAPAANLLVLSGGIQAPLRRGQILQVMCAGAAQTTYVTVAAAVAANWFPPAAAPANTRVTLQGATGVFPYQNARLVLPASCFQNDWANLRIHRVDRFRYYVGTFADSGSALTRPYLMLDRGLQDDDGTALDEPVAPDVEDLQFEYVFYNPVTALTRSVGGLVGGMAGTRLSSSAASIDLAAAPPDITSVGEDPARLTNSPANIRAVRVSVVTRSPGTDSTKVRQVAQLVASQGPVIPAAANRPVIVDATRANDPNFGLHVRIRVDSAFETRNLDARAPFYDR